MRRELTIAAAILLAVVGGQAAGATELVGRVTFVHGAKLRIAVDGGGTPREGDPFEVFVDIPGIGEAQVATGRIAVALSKSVLGKVGQATGRVKPDQKVRISQKPSSATNPADAGFVSLFDGKKLDGWSGPAEHYFPANGCLVSEFGSTANAGEQDQLYTARSYADFALRFDFRLTRGANSGVMLRAPFPVKSSREALELQIIDDSTPDVATMPAWFRNGAIHRVLEPRQAASKAPGDWVSAEISWVGPSLEIVMDGQLIVDTDTANPDDKLPTAGDHPGLSRDAGRIVFNGFGSRGRVEYRNIRIMEL
jgi:hypothetical protein